MKKALLATSAALLLAPVLVLACFTPADLYAFEVVLNKPGVEYDLSKLPIGQVEPGVYAYRSPVDERFLVILSEQKLFPESSAKFLALRLQVPLRRLSQQTFSCKISLGEIAVLGPVSLQLSAGSGEADIDLGSLDLSGVGVLIFAPALKLDAADSVRVSAGGVLELQSTKSSYKVLTPCFFTHNENCARITMVIPGYDEPMTVDPGSYKVKFKVSWTSSRDTSGKLLVYVRGVVLDPEAISGWQLGVKPLHYPLLSKEFEEGEVEVAFTRSSLEARVRAANLDHALEEVRQLVKKLKVECALEPSGSLEVEESPAYSVSRDELASTLKAELDWLRRTGAVTGLTDADVEAAAKVASMGLAGWNSRIVWWNEEWRPYNTVEGAVLLRCVGSPPRVALLESAQQTPLRPGSGDAVAGASGAVSFTPTFALAGALLLGSIVGVYILWRRKSKAPG